MKGLIVATAATLVLCASPVMAESIPTNAQAHAFDASHTANTFYCSSMTDIAIMRGDVTRLTRQEMRSLAVFANLCDESMSKAHDSLAARAIPKYVLRNACLLLENEIVACASIGKRP